MCVLVFYIYLYGESFYPKWLAFKLSSSGVRYKDLSSEASDPQSKALTTEPPQSVFDL